MTVNKSRAVLRDFAEALFSELRAIGHTGGFSDETRRKIIARAVNKYFAKRGNVAKAHQR